MRQLFEAAPAAAQPVAAIALGGYGRRQLCLFSDIDVLVLFEQPIGAADERFLHGFLTPLWDLGVVVGHQVRELADFHDARDRQPRVSAGAARCAPARRRSRAVRSLHGDVPPAGDPRAHRGVARRVDRGPPRPLQRHALSARAGHQGGAGRAARSDRRADDRRPDRSGADHQRAGRSGASRGGRGLSAADPVDAAPQVRTQPERADPRTAGSDRRGARLLRRAAAAAGRAADGRLLPPRADRQPIARVGAEIRADAGRRKPRAASAAASASSIRSRRRGGPKRGCARSRPRSVHGCEVLEDGALGGAAERDPLSGRGFFPDAPSRATSCCGS